MSLLQACAFNAKFKLHHGEWRSYIEITLQAFNSKRARHVVSDTSSKGIATSVYQEMENGSLAPVDQLDRALLPVENVWCS